MLRAREVSNAHKISTVLSRKAIEPILETRKIRLQHMSKTKKIVILTEDPPIPLMRVLGLKLS